MKKHLAIISCLLPLLLSCGEEGPQWTPGAPDDEYSIGVYFDMDNPSSLILDPDQASKITFTLHREKAASAVTVPLIVTTDLEGMIFPESVHFDAGSRDAEITVDCSRMPQRTMGHYSITVPDEYLHIYSATNYNSHNGSILVSVWEPARTDGSKVKFIFTDNDYLAYPTSTPTEAAYRPYESEMEVLPGANLYRVHDFLGSGRDFDFSLAESPYPSYVGLYRVNPAERFRDPETAQYLDVDSWMHSYLLLNGEDDELMECHVQSLDGVDVTLELFGFCTYYPPYSTEYSYARISGTEGKTRTDCAASMMICTAYHKDYWLPNVTLPDYFYLYFEWDRNAE